MGCHVLVLWLVNIGEVRGYIFIGPGVLRVHRLREGKYDSRVLRVTICSYSSILLHVEQRENMEKKQNQVDGF